jgi:DNA-binding beta-propeller fold protein YncE
VAVDAAGNLYIADSGNHRIRKVTPDGVIRTVAGDGFTDIFDGGRFAGDGGPAIRASLSHPSGVAVDAAGNLFIADSFNHVIRRVGADGIISTVAGMPPVPDPFFGGGFLGGGFSGDGGPATRALMLFPTGVAVDASGNLYIADSENHRIRKVGSDGIIATVAGNGARDPSGYRPFSGVPANLLDLPAPTVLLLWHAGESGEHCCHSRLNVHSHRALSAKHADTTYSTGFVQRREFDRQGIPPFVYEAPRRGCVCTRPVDDMPFLHRERAFL